MSFNLDNFGSAVIWESMRAFRWERRAKICKLPMEIVMRIVPKEAKTGSLGILAGSSEEKILPTSLIAEKVSFLEGFINSTGERNCALRGFSSRKDCFLCRLCSLPSAIKAFLLIWLHDFCSVSSCPLCPPARVPKIAKTQAA